jgi:hypothetical protein
MSDNIRFLPNVYFKLANTEKMFYQDIYSNYSCAELYEKILVNVNNNLRENESNLETSSKFEIVPSRNTESGLPLRKINTKLYEILKQEDMQAFYIRFI